MRKTSTFNKRVKKIKFLARISKGGERRREEEKEGKGEEGRKRRRKGRK